MEEPELLTKQQQVDNIMKDTNVAGECLRKEPDPNNPEESVEKMKDCIISTKDEQIKTLQNHFKNPKTLVIFGGKKRSKTRRKTKHKRKSKHKRRKHRRHSHKK